MSSTRPPTQELSAYGTEQGLADDIRLDFELLCADLALAKEAVRTKDTPAARTRLTACRDLVDAVLDLSNDAGGTRS
jgi:hypothetical protein